MNYYNEWEPYAAEWLRSLIQAGLLPKGDVDERSIKEVNPGDLRGYSQCHFFAGVGGWSRALELAGVPAAYPLWTGSCPCQPFSSAGDQTGVADERHLWPDWFRLIRECCPPIIFGEQVEGAIRHGWLDLVFADLEAEGYACGAVVLGAHSVGSPHIRQRLYWVGGLEHAKGGGRLRDGINSEAAGGLGVAREGGSQGFWDGAEWLPCSDGKARPIKPGIEPLANGVPQRVGRLRAYGNAIVPQAAAEFIKAALGCEEAE